METGNLQSIIFVQDAENTLYDPWAMQNIKELESKKFDMKWW